MSRWSDLFNALSGGATADTLDTVDTLDNEVQKPKNSAGLDGSKLSTLLSDIQTVSKPKWVR